MQIIPTLIHTPKASFSNQIPENRYPQTPLFPPSRYPQPIKVEICHPIGAVSGYFQLQYSPR
jgi:hypothetical protein